MFGLLLLVCSVSFGSANSEISEKTELSLRKASYSGNEWLYSTLAKAQNNSETALPAARGRASIPTDLSSWIEFPVLPLVFASSGTLPEGRCKEHARRYLQELGNSTLWAVQSEHLNQDFRAAGSSALHCILQAWSHVLFIILAVGLSITSQSQGAKYFAPNSDVLHPIETAAYAGFHRIGFALGICSIVVLITIGDGLGFHYKFMTPRWVPPFARLTYGAFLVHNINQGYEIGVTRTPRIFTIHNCFWDFVPDTFYTFALSLLLSISVEGPIRKIEKLMLTKRSSNSPEKPSKAIEDIVFNFGSSSNGIKKIN